MPNGIKRAETGNTATIPVFSFPIPNWGERDPYFGKTRTDWITAAVPGKGRPNPPVQSYRSAGPGRGRRLIVYASALEHEQAIAAAQNGKAGAS